MPEVSETLGIAETTVRFHLRQLFEKTGTHRQADLVKLLAGFANPLVEWGWLQANGTQPSGERIEDSAGGISRERETWTSL